MEGFGFPGPRQPCEPGWMLVTATCLVLLLSLSWLFPEVSISLFPVLPVFLYQHSSILHLGPCRDGGSSSLCCCLCPLSLSTVQEDVLFLAYRPSLLFLLPHCSFLPHWVSPSTLFKSNLSAVESWLVGLHYALQSLAGKRGKCRSAKGSSTQKSKVLKTKALLHLQFHKVLVLSG